MNYRNIVRVSPLGWNSWDCFGAGVTEEELRANADYMAKNLKQYGWSYIVCDIQWYEPNAKDNDYNNFTELSMDEYSRLIPAENRFPSSKNGMGFKPIADYCHSLGLKFGIHIMRGIPRQAVHKNTPIKNSTFTARDVAHHFSVCSWNTDMYGMKNCPGAQEYYNSIFELYAEWGVDFIKCDDACVTEFSRFDNPYSADYEIEMIRKAIDSTGRKMVLSLSPGPAQKENAGHLANNCDMWRITGDFWDNWDQLYAMFEKCHQWENWANSCFHPDCDMLPIGRLSKNGECHGPQNRMTQLKKPEQLTLMTLWGIFRSPLFIGGNLVENDEWTLSLLTNEEYMTMHRTCKNQRQEFRYERINGGDIMWLAEGNDCKYVAVFNTRRNHRRFKFNLGRVLMPGEEYSVYDIWDKYSMGKSVSYVEFTVPPHGAKLLKISAKQTDVK